MGQWGLSERRHFLRYDVMLSALARKEPVVDPLTASAHDISTRGFGLVSGVQFQPGDIVDVSFIIPDSAEQLSAKGIVVWTSAIGPSRYRAGAAVTGPELNPISVVLRSIRARTSRYHV